MAHSHAVPYTFFSPSRPHQQGAIRLTSPTPFMNHARHTPDKLCYTSLPAAYASFLASVNNAGLYSLQNLLILFKQQLKFAVEIGKGDRFVPASLGGFMYQYTPRYPKAFGHPAWKLYGPVNDALLQDLFWRKVQTDPGLVSRLSTILDPAAMTIGNDIFLSDNTAISLLPESCGAYTTPRNRWLNRLHGNSEDKKLIFEVEEYPAAGGLYLGPLFQQKKGWLPQNVYSNILQHLGVSFTQEDRYLFNRKACHNSVLMTDIDKQHAEQTIEGFTIDFGFKEFRVYWYSTENGSTAFGIVYFFDDSGMVTKLPISAWQRAGNVVFDLLYPPHNCPLYDLHELSRLRDKSKYVLICENEETYETIKHDHAWLPKVLPVTTYSSVEMSDWSSIRSMTPLIFPDNSPAGCHEAFKVFSVLKTYGLSPYFFKRQKINNISSFVQDISAIARQDGECSLPDFAEHCRREFGVEAPQGILPQGQPLLELSGSEDEQEVLMENLLRLGDQMTVFAWRGVGKSLFALLLALCFANGHKALNGRVRPSRKYRVLLIDGEMSSRSLQMRARSIINALGLPEDAANKLQVRSSVVDKKDLVLDTEEGWIDLLPDLEAADIIIVDSLFKIIPSAMSSDYTATKELNNFYSWCRRHGKTGIVVDHQGKNGHAAFGSMGKDIGVDAALQLSRPKNKNIIEATVTKNRNFEFNDPCWVRYSIKNESGRLTFQFNDQAAISSSAAALPASEDEVMENSDDNMSIPNKPDINQTIIDYITKHPDQAQGEVVTELMEPLQLGRSALSVRIKQLREAGNLNFWKKAPAAKGKHEVSSSASGEPDKGE